MVKQLNIAFLWHMHQPIYLDPLTQSFIMPWVRLHALKDYLDIPRAMLKNPGAKFNINFVPSLLTQLDDYIEERYADLYLKVAQKRTEDLSDWEKNFLIKSFFNINAERIIMKVPRYRELFLKRQGTPEGEWLDRFSNQDLIDLAVHFHLGWSGTKLVEGSPFIQELIAKGHQYSEGEKRQLLDEQHQFLKEVKQYIQDLSRDPRVEVSVTPFYHPIIPVMNDIKNVPKAWEGSVLPNNFRNMKHYAREHVKQGIEYGREYFEEVHGMWPAEGSVSTDFIELLKPFNIEWVATDEAILGKTFGHNPNLEELATPYNYNGVNFFFRNHALSDKIGFVYSNWDTESGVQDFINELGHFRNAIHREDNLITVILDGENAWEYYDQNGEPFLTRLFDALSKTPWLNLTTFHEYIGQHQNEIPKLHSLMPGSWIDGNFNTWINEPTKNRYWEILFTLQGVIDNLRENKLISETKFKEIERYFMIAQGSDWMWWAGEGHSSANDADFDRLFRNYVLKIYQLLDKDPPADLYEPLYTHQKNISYLEPLHLIQPRITGKLDDYYGWVSCGELYAEQGAIHKTEVILKQVNFGFDHENLYFQIIPFEDITQFKDNDITVGVEFIGLKEIDLKHDTHIISKCEEVFETAIPMSYIKSDFKPGDRLKFRFLMQTADGNTLERLPNSDLVEIEIPDPFFDINNWSV